MKTHALGFGVVSYKNEQKCDQTIGSSSKKHWSGQQSRPAKGTDLELQPLSHRPIMHLVADSLPDFIPLCIALKVSDNCSIIQQNKLSRQGVEEGTLGIHYTL